MKAPTGAMLRCLRMISAGPTRARDLTAELGRDANTECWRLKERGLVQTRGGTKGWTLTPQGRRMVQSIDAAEAILGEALE